MDDAVPSHMEAVWVREPGGAEELEVRSLDTPSPGAGEVLIKVAAAGVNRGDIVLRQGIYPRPPEMSEILGLEVAGTIVATGDGVDAGRIGEEVCALVLGGGYAQHCVAPVETLLPVPGGVSLEDAASLPEAYFTVWAAMIEAGRLSVGESILVHGGAGGIGTAAIMLAKQMGAHVLATAGSDAKCEACRALGADVAINYKIEDFVERTARHTKDGANLVLDMIGGSYLMRNIACLAPRGRVISIAFQSSPQAMLDLRPLVMKEATIAGSILHSRDRAAKKRLADALLSEVWPAIAAGQLRTVVDSKYPMREAAAAHARMEAGLHTGKILLTMA